MFHVEQNNKDLHCDSKDYLVTGESFKVYLDENKIIGKTIPAPKKGEMFKYYDSNQYLPHSYNKKNLISILYSMVKRQMHRKKLEWMSRHLNQNSSVLDYGCGTGDFVKYLRAKSVMAYGYDPNIKFNPDSPDYLTNNFDWVGNKYDIIFLWHVLEHTHDPFVLLQGLKKRLNKNGKIFIAIPNFKSFDSKYYRKYWAGYDLPRHLWHFSRRSICQIAEQNNFKIIKEKSLYLDAIYVSFLSEKYKLSRFPFLQGSIIGSISIVGSFFTKQSSSFLFVFNKP